MPTTEQPRPDPEHVDPEAPARLRRQGSDKLIRAVVESFIERSPKRFREARAALEAGDFESVARIFHNLKSTFRMVGTLHLGKLCEAAEQLAGERDATGVRPLLDEIESEFHAVSPWVRSFVESGDR